MKFRPEHYIEASKERINTSRKLYNEQHYPEAIYLAGVAVECLLLAYRTRSEPEFKSRHDLKNLLKESGIADFIKVTERTQFPALLGDIWSRWKNNYRFASYERLTSEFKRLKLDRGITGDILKTNSSIVINSSMTIINIGIRRWNLKKN